jgi:hypothetical protein
VGDAEAAAGLRLGDGGADAGTATDTGRNDGRYKGAHVSCDRVIQRGRRVPPAIALWQAGARAHCTLVVKVG